MTRLRQIIDTLTRVKSALDELIHSTKVPPGKPPCANNASNLCTLHDTSFKQKDAHAWNPVDRTRVFALLN
jgi:hypothetical protein